MVWKLNITIIVSKIISYQYNDSIVKTDENVQNILINKLKSFICGYYLLSLTHRVYLQYCIWVHKYKEDSDSEYKKAHNWNTANTEEQYQDVWFHLPLCCADLWNALVFYWLHLSSNKSAGHTNGSICLYQVEIKQFT